MKSRFQIASMFFVAELRFWVDEVLGGRGSDGRGLGGRFDQKMTDFEEQETSLSLIRYSKLLKSFSAAFDAMKKECS